VRAPALLRRLVTGLRRRRARPRRRRLLVPFTGGGLDRTVLEAALRIARAEDAKLVPAYLILIPLQFPLDAAMVEQVAVAMPLLEAVEHAALRQGIPVDARVESGRTPIHALERLWAVERFDRIVVPAPLGHAPGFAPKDLQWILAHAPSETVILRPGPGETGNASPRAAAAPLDRRERVGLRLARDGDALGDGDRLVRRPDVRVRGAPARDAP
jgi:hypothetical protein